MTRIYKYYVAFWENAMTEDANGKDRRKSITTLVDPKTLPTVIPIILAIGGAFLFHDRSINTLQVTVTQHEQVIGKNSNRAELVNQVQNRLGILEYDVESLSHEDAKVEIQIKTIEQEIAQLKADVRLGEYHATQILEKIDKLEQKVNQLK
jgi:hypothetical protein